MNHLCAYVEGTPKQLPARVVAILDECDLSVLSQGLNVSKTRGVMHWKRMNIALGLKHQGTLSRACVN